MYIQTYSLHPKPMVKPIKDFNNRPPLKTPNIKIYHNHFTFILSCSQSILNYCTLFLSIVFVLKKLCQSCKSKSFITCQKERGQRIASRCEAFSLIAAFISCLCFFRQPITPQRELLLKYTVIL